MDEVERMKFGDGQARAVFTLAERMATICVASSMRSATVLPLPCPIR
jgi:hypothetical protein